MIPEANVRKKLISNVELQSFLLENKTRKYERWISMSISLSRNRPTCRGQYFAACLLHLAIQNSNNEKKSTSKAASIWFSLFIIVSQHPSQGDNRI